MIIFYGCNCVTIAPYSVTVTPSTATIALPVVTITVFYFLKMHPNKKIVTIISKD